MDDQAAIERCRAGDKEAFRHVVERYQAEAIGHAIAILGNREDARMRFKKHSSTLSRHSIGSILRGDSTHGST